MGTLVVLTSGGFYLRRYEVSSKEMSLTEDKLTDSTKTELDRFFEGTTTHITFLRKDFFPE
jgi:hypothetical protein